MESNPISTSESSEFHPSSNIARSIGSGEGQPPHKVEVVSLLAYSTKGGFMKIPALQQGGLLWLMTPMVDLLPWMPFLIVNNSNSKFVAKPKVLINMLIPPSKPISNLRTNQLP